MSYAKSRNTDPVTSYMAADKVEREGTAETQRQKCYAEVARMEGQTSAEIAKRLEVDRYTPSRRLPELRDAGIVQNGNHRKCMVTGNKSMTWYLRLPRPAQHLFHMEGKSA